MMNASIRSKEKAFPFARHSQLEDPRGGLRLPGSDVRAELGAQYRTALPAHRE